MCFACLLLGQASRGLHNDPGLGLVARLGPSGPIPPDFLIGDALVDFSRSTVLLDSRLSLHLQVHGGSTAVGGGVFGAQTIEALPVDLGLQWFYRNTIERLDQLIAIDFDWASSAQEADVRIYLDREIKLDGMGQVLGLALSHSGQSGSWWELFLNATALAENPSYLRYALLHEMGHVMGLEHLFDFSDGDIYGSANPALSAFPEDTVMAYRSPLHGLWPQWFSDNDLEALIRIWGAEFQLYGETADFIVGANYSELIGGGLGDDTIHGGLGADTLLGGQGDDRLFGGPWADQLFGRHGNDTLHGGLGRDWLDGGPGFDELWGGMGPDTFVISPGSDWAVDFNPAQGDRIGFRNPSSVWFQQTATGLQLNTDVGVLTLLGFDQQAFDPVSQIVVV